MNKTELFYGIDLYYLDIKATGFTFNDDLNSNIIEINYCLNGRMGLKLESGIDVYIGPKDFLIHNINILNNASLIFPTENYQGLKILIDLDKVKENPLIFEDKIIINDYLLAKLAKVNYLSFSSTKDSENIFSYFYEENLEYRNIYQKLKTIELLLYLSKLELASTINKNESEQVKLIREIHDYLIANMDKRITIKDLSHKYLMNPTTLKESFKEVYGLSIASHIKEHRMTHSAKLLKETDMSIAEIALSVGYDSQSRFSEAFKAYYGILPTEYRKENR